MYDNNKYFCKFKRGQIWYVKRNTTQTYKVMADKDNHITQKSRPYLIVSTNISNKNAPILNCVPISSSTSPLPCHVKVLLDKGFSYITCEQITTLNKKNFEDAIYIGELNDDIMQQVEVALANQLGLSIQIPSLETVQSFIEKLANTKAEEMKATSIQATDDYVLSIAERLEDIFNIKSTNTVIVENSSKSIKPEALDTQECNESVVVENKEIENTVKSMSNNSENKRIRRKWNTEDMQQFMIDAEKLSNEEMCIKYNMNTKSVYSIKYRFKNILNKSNT